MKLSHISTLALLVTFAGAGTLLADSTRFALEPECVNELFVVATGDCPESNKEECDERLPTGCVSKPDPASTCTEKETGFNLYCKVQTEE